MNEDRMTKLLRKLLAEWHSFDLFITEFKGEVDRMVNDEEYGAALEMALDLNVSRMSKIINVLKTEAGITLVKKYDDGDGESRYERF